MPAPTRRERPAYRARWRPVPNAAHLPPPGRRTTPVPSRQVPGRSVPPPASRLESRFSEGLDLPLLFTPAEAAEILQQLGLPEMTECALRTRAYRRQVPFHLNGRRIRFTADDLREIVEGQAQRPGADKTPYRNQPAGRRIDGHKPARPTIRRRPGALASHVPHRLPNGRSHDEAAQAEAMGRNKPSRPHPVSSGDSSDQRYWTAFYDDPEEARADATTQITEQLKGSWQERSGRRMLARRLDRRLGRPCSATSSRPPAPSTSTSSKATSCPSSRDASSAR